MYLTTSTNETVRPKLERELNHGARIVTHDFPMTNWARAPTAMFKAKRVRRAWLRIFKGVVYELWLAL